MKLVEIWPLKDQKNLQYNSFTFGKAVASPVCLLRYDLPNGFTYLQLGRDFVNTLTSETAYS